MIKIKPSFLFLASLSLVTALNVGLFGVEAAQTKCNKFNPFCKNGIIRRTGRQIDPTRQQTIKVSPARLVTQSVWYDPNFTQAEKEKLQQAITIINTVNNNPNLKQCINKYGNFHGRARRDEFTVDTRKEEGFKIYQKAMYQNSAGNPTIKIHRYTKAAAQNATTAELGYAEIDSYKKKGRYEFFVNEIALNSQRTPAVFADTIVHEVLHAAGYDHPVDLGNNFANVTENLVYETGWCFSRADTLGKKVGDPFLTDFDYRHFVDGNPPVEENRNTLVSNTRTNWQYSVLTYEDTRNGGQGKFVVRKEGTPKQVELTTGNGKLDIYDVMKVTPEYIITHRNLYPGAEYYIRLHTNGYVDYTTGKDMSENGWSKWTEGKWDAPPTPPACSAKYDPSKYRPGTSGWTGKVAKIALNNGGANPVQIKLYHPDAPDQVFKEWTAQPGQNIFLDENNYGMDWGIQVNNSPVCIVGRVSAWNQFNGESIFQSEFPLKIHN